MNMNLDQLEETMTFEPLAPAGKSPGALTGPRLTFAVRKRSKKNGTHLYLSVRPDMAAEMQLAAGDYLRVDCNVAEGIGRLRALECECESGGSRKVRLTASGRAEWKLPWSGPVAKAFPQALRTELEVIGVRPFDLFFRLPGGRVSVAVVEPEAEGSAWGRSRL